MMDVAPIGSFYGPDLTGGPGSRVNHFTSADWDRIVRHGVFPMATGKLKLSADEVSAHDAEHLVLPPVADTTLEFGGHLAGVCTGCHEAALAGGPIVGGDPSRPPAANLTPTGVGGWSYEQFVTALREARKPDGAELLPPMDCVAPYAQRMTDVELQALWMYLRSLPPTRTPGA